MPKKKTYTVSLDPEIKDSAQKAAKSLGISLSQVIELSLRKFVENPTLGSFATDNLR